MADKSKKEQNPDVGAKPREDELGIEIGVETNLPFATPYIDPTATPDSRNKKLQELLHPEGGDSGPTVSQLVAMRRMDGQARALYRLLTLPIRAALAKSTFVPAEGGEAEADFITQQFTLPPASGGMSVTFHRFMSQLLQALFDGFAPFEQVYDYATHGPLKGKYVLRKLAYRQPSTITVIEDDGHFAGFRQRAYRNGEAIDVYIPRDRSFYFAAQEEENKYYGVSFFQSAFYHYDKKVKIYYVAHLAAQRAAVGTRVGTYPANATAAQKSTFAQNLSNLAVAQWMMLPDDFKVEALREGGSFDFLNYINHHNSQMSKSVLANFFDQETGGGSSDAKLVSFGQPGDSMFVLMLRAIMDDIANSINHYIIPRLIDWNFDGGKYPTFQWAELTDEQKSLVSKTFTELATAGQSATVTPEFIREIEKKMALEMGLDIDWDEVEQREEEEKEAQMAQQGLNPDGTPMQPTAQDLDAINNALSSQNPSQETTPAPTGASSSESAALSEDRLLSSAEELLELARTDRRIVRTPAGARRFDTPIGQPIPNSSGGSTDPGYNDNTPTVERLQSLKMQYDGARQAGNTQLATKILKKLRRAVYDFSGSWRPSVFLDTMNKLSTSQLSKTPTSDKAVKESDPGDKKKSE